ncbi:MAG: cupredoxin domain-containing protein [Candidatus Rokubacteria bacterium]|nr:cupredoxin domain-containing protein [Candidatus Rokubacteria bacterium]
MRTARILAAGLLTWGWLAGAGEPSDVGAPRLARSERVAQARPTVQEFEMTMNVFPTGKFAPDPLTVKKGIRVRLRMKALQREHLNQISIRPFVANVTLEPPDKVTIIEFTPTRTGTFKIRNLGHDFEGTLVVVE